MPAPTLFNCFTEDLAEKVHNLGSDTIKAMLSNTAPGATNTVPGDITEITAGNGYTAGGVSLTVSASAQTSGVYKLTISDPTPWTAAGGSIGPARYLVVYNNTASKLMWYYDYGASFTAAIGEQIIPDFDGTNGAITIT